MKRKIYLMMISLLILLAVIKIDAQQWVKMNPQFNPPGNYNLERGIFLDENNGWFADNGKIFQTTNGGLLWNINIDLGYNIGGYSDVFFIDSLNGWVLFKPWSDSTIVCNTTDGGQNWKIIKVPPIYSFYFTNKANGVGIYKDSIYHTTDSGLTWRKINLEPYEGQLGLGGSSIFFLNEKKGWLVGGRYVGPTGGGYEYPVILVTDNGGNSWLFKNYNTISNIDNRGLRVIAFADSLYGIICDNNGYCYTTKDSGNEWIQNSIIGMIANVLFTDSNEGWMTGAQGFIAHSTDRGQTWKKMKSPYSKFLGKISFVKNKTIGFILGWENTLLRYDKTVHVQDYDTKLIPEKLILYQNYPNPFNSSTILTFELPEDNFMELKLYDLLGRTIKVLEKGFMNSGEHKVLLNAQTLSSGTYFCLLKQGNYFSKIKLILIK